MDTLQNLYEMFGSAHLSLTALSAIVLTLTLAFLYSSREAAAWFFKVNDIKKDIGLLNEGLSQIEGEIRGLKSLFAEAKVQQPVLNLVTRDHDDASTQTSAKTSGEKEKPMSADSHASAFPIVH